MSAAYAPPPFELQPWIFSGRAPQARLDALSPWGTDLIAQWPSPA